MTKANGDTSVMIEANKEWRKFIDILEQHDKETYLNLWMKVPSATDKVISNDYQRWRHIVQKAFFDGYEAGFTDRLFKGKLSHD